VEQHKDLGIALDEIAKVGDHRMQRFPFGVSPLDDPGDPFIEKGLIR
jgi:hypothetical protein